MTVSPEHLPSSPQPRILVLTYHEITEDARVAKQAKAAAAVGCEVTVLSDLKLGKPRDDEIDGFKVKRFRCLDPTLLAKTKLPPLAFLRDSEEKVAVGLYSYRKSIRRWNRLFWFRKVDSFLEQRIRPLQEQPDTGFAERMGWKTKRIYNRAIRSTRRVTRLSDRAARRFLTPRLHETFAASQYLKALVYATNAMSVPLERHDLIHAHDLHTLPTALLLAQRFGAKVVYDAHEYEPARVSRADDATRALDDAFEFDCLRSVDAVVSVSESICELYAKRFPGPFPTLIMNVPEFGAVATEEAEVCVRRQAGLPSETPLIVFTGGVQRENRGLDKVLAALRDLEGFHLAILGPRHITNDLWLTTHAAKLGVRSRLHLLPPVRAASVPQAVASADVAVCPIQDVTLSYRHSMPNKLFEAAFFGIPICLTFPT